MSDRAVYNEETSLWRKENDDLSVKNAVKGEKIAQIIEVKADTYPEAFEKLFGYSVFSPAPERAVRRNADSA